MEKKDDKVWMGVKTKYSKSRSFVWQKRKFLQKNIPAKMFLGELSFYGYELDMK